MELYAGIALMVLGVVLFFIGRTPNSSSRAVHVTASEGSVAIGGNNKGDITNVNLGASQDKQHGTHWLTWVAIAVELVGIAVTLWHAWHLAGK
jgi:hypothetical protein